MISAHLLLFFRLFLFEQIQLVILKAICALNIAVLMYLFPSFMAAILLRTTFAKISALVGTF